MVQNLLRPQQRHLVIAGDITPEVARQKVEKYYGAIPAGPPIAHQEVWIAKRTGTHRGTGCRIACPRPVLYRVWNVPQTGSPEEALLDLAAQRSRPGQNVAPLQAPGLQGSDRHQRHRRTTTTTRSPASFLLTLTAKPGADLKKVETAADEELQNFLKDGPTESELQLAKTQIFGQYARIMERIGGFGGKSDILARCQTFTGQSGLLQGRI